MNILRKPDKKTPGQTLTLYMDQEHKRRYTTLSEEHGIEMAEHMRRVMYPEIDRLWKSETGEESSQE